MTVARKNGPLRQLFLVDVKARLINNTPYDVYRTASLFARDDVDVIDLRFHSRGEPLPESESVVLFLETAGTWMCFDWDPARFIARVGELVAAYPRCTVVGPQAQALKALTGYSFDVIDTLDFRSVLAPPSGHADTAMASAWLDVDRHRAYNGEHFDGRQMRLVPTFSIAFSMNCPLRCDFCYYGDASRVTRPAFAEMMHDIERIWAHGHRHFYFMDPNFLPSLPQFEALRELHARTNGRFTYFCQVSPNYLSEARLRQFAASGCRGMAIGIENADRIAAKGSIDEARAGVARVRALGMMPMLFFMIDGQHDIEALIGEFAGTPFRYTVLNEAFAGPRSLQAIEAGFVRKSHLAAQHSDLLRRLQQQPAYLGRLPVGWTATGVVGSAA